MLQQRNGGQIKSNISEKVTPIVQDVQGKWNTLKTNAVNTWGDIKSSIGNKVNEIKNAVSEKFTEMINSAKNWGRNMIQGFIDGIKAMASKVKDAASGIVKSVASFLGFHSPAKEGEGRHIIEWGENMILGFMDGIDNESANLRAKMNSLLKAPDLTANLDVGLNSLKRQANVGYGNTTNNTTNNNNSNFTLKIDKFINEREQDIENLVEEIEFYRNRKLAAKGG